MTWWVLVLKNCKYVNKWKSDSRLFIFYICTLMCKQGRCEGESYVWQKYYSLTCLKHSCTILTFSLLEYSTDRTISYSVLLWSSPAWLEWMESWSAVPIYSPDVPVREFDERSWLSPFASMLSFESSPTPGGVSVRAEQDKPLQSEKKDLFLIYF